MEYVNAIEMNVIQLKTLKYLEVSKSDPAQQSRGPRPRPGNTAQ